jgi:thioredoxin reductase
MGDNRPTCIHNAATGRETQWQQVIEPSTEGARKAVVVGAGPAGLEAARILAERGHQVKLFEATDQPGGQLRMASAASWRRDVIGIIDWRMSELDRLGVDIQYNTLAEVKDVLGEDPDIVIVASGGIPDLDWLKGVDHCTSSWDILSGSSKPAENVIVYDGTGRHAALTAAEFCHDAGSRVQLVLLDEQPVAELVYGERVIWRRELALRKLIPILEHKLIEVKQQGSHVNAVFINDLTEEELVLTADQIIVEHGTIPADGIFHELRGASSNNGIIDIPALLAGQPQPVPDGLKSYSLFRIGDAVSSRNLAAAMFDALRLCSVI